VDNGQWTMGNGRGQGPGPSERERVMEVHNRPNCGLQRTPYMHHSTSRRMQ
jgi:hypothetical protein